MKDLGIGIGAFFAAIGGIILLVVMFTHTDVALSRKYDPQREEIRRQTFEESRAFREGLAQELQAMQLDYLKGNEDQKAAIASMVLHRVAGVDPSVFPPSLQRFIDQLKTQKGMQ